MSISAGGAVLELDGVVKHYGGYGGELVRAVDGVSLEVAAGELVVIQGPSGSGKSTLLMLAAGLLAPDAGSVRLQGRDLATLSARELADCQRRKIGFVYQSFHLMAGVPAVENAAIKLLADRVPLKQARSAALPWLERVGLAARLNHTPDRLSGGERQRVAIARALVNRPSLILADEPTGSLDSRRGAQILALLAQIAHEQRVAVLLVTHDPQAADVCDRICPMRDGRLEPAHERPADGRLEAADRRLEPAGERPADRRLDPSHERLEPTEPIPLSSSERTAGRPRRASG